MNGRNMCGGWHSSMLRIWVVFSLAALLPMLPARSATRAWIGATGNWNNAANWDGGASVPGPSDDVAITNTGASVMLTSSTNVLSLTLSQTLTFSNWNTCLSVTNDVVIASNGVMTCAGPITNNAMSNRVYIVCSNLIVAAGGSINVDSNGYDGGYSDLVGGYGNGQGPGGGACYYYPHEGGMYGGFGDWGEPDWYRTTLGNTPYGAPDAPEWPGSGGAGARWRKGGAGGGAVRIIASGCVTVNGAISANGETGLTGWYTPAASGSGGGIYITCDRFAGTNGVVRANGGDEASLPAGYGEGGGGRIAVHYNTNSQSSVALPTVQFTVLPGMDLWPRAGTRGGYYGDIGSLWFPDTRFWSTNMALLQGQLFGVTSWTVSTLILSNRWVGFSPEGFALTVTGDVRVEGLYGGLSLGGPLSANHSGGGLAAYYRYGTGTLASMTVAGNLLITNSARMFVYSTETNASQPDYGALIRVQGDMRISTNSWVYLSSAPTNGGSPKFWVNNLAIDQGGTISADYKGYAGGGVGSNGFGPGGGTSSYNNAGGGGYGGVGGGDPGCGGQTYGSYKAPMAPGSGGAGRNSGSRANWGHPGGGLVRIQADGRLDLNGTISANGQDEATIASGAGSGGGVYLRCGTFIGSANGVIRANGGNVLAGAGGGGGGGRIAVWRDYDISVGVVSTSVTNGTTSVGTSTVGTVWWSPPRGTIIKIY